MIVKYQTVQELKYSNIIAWLLITNEICSNPCDQDLFTFTLIVLKTWLKKKITENISGICNS